MVQQDLFLKIYGRALDSDEASAFLLQQTEKHPYFGLNHYFLLCNTSSDDPSFANRLLRTGLVMTDHFHLQRMLESKDLVSPLEPALHLSETTAPTTDSLKDSIQTVLEGINSHAEPSIDAPLFEPLHTTDYFASQGIKLSEQVAPDDKLGKQMRSFTEWLKTIKKTPTVKLNVSAEQLDQTVEKMAETSNHEAEVITEAMAEVFLQQGKIEKAAEIYQKLSLQYPSKSVYFANKIDHLK
jgi:hypothetical protein